MCADDAPLRSPTGGIACAAEAANVNMAAAEIQRIDLRIELPPAFCSARTWFGERHMRNE